MRPRRAARGRTLAALAIALTTALTAGLPAAAPAGATARADSAVATTVGATVGTTTDPATDPTAGPTSTTDPTTGPSPEPTTEPTDDPTTDPSPEPTGDPTADPSPEPTDDPTTDPSSDPTDDPSTEPTTDPGVDPSPAPPIPDAPRAEETPATQAPLEEPLAPSAPTTWDFPDLSLLPSDVLARRWPNPVLGRSTSSFGYRIHPVTGLPTVHSGQDVATACGTPVHAASDGVVVFVGLNFQGRTGNQVVIAHGGGVITRYGHLLTGTTAVALGDHVAAGQQIAQVGGNRAIDPVGAGMSTGCHLHFEVNLDDGSDPVHPGQFLAALGVTLGVDTPLTPDASASALDSPDNPDSPDGRHITANDRLVTVDVIPGALPHLEVEKALDAPPT